MESDLTLKYCHLAASSKVIAVNECLNSLPAETNRLKPTELFDFFTADVMRKQLVFVR